MRIFLDDYREMNLKLQRDVSAAEVEAEALTCPLASAKAWDTAAWMARKVAEHTNYHVNYFCYSLPIQPELAWLVEIASAYQGLAREWDKKAWDCWNRTSWGQQNKREEGDWRSLLNVLELKAYEKAKEAHYTSCPYTCREAADLLDEIADMSYRRSDYLNDRMLDIWIKEAYYAERSGRKWSTEATNLREMARKLRESAQHYGYEGDD